MTNGLLPSLNSHQDVFFYQSSSCTLEFYPFPKSKAFQGGVHREPMVLGLAVFESHSIE